MTARNAELFLTRNDAEFRTGGWRHYREVRSLHLENVAVTALTQRHYRLGLRYLLRSARGGSLAPARALRRARARAAGCVARHSWLHRLAGWPVP